MYAPLHKKFWPDGTEEIVWLHKKLQQINAGYGLEVLSKSLAWMEGPAHEYRVFRWSEQRPNNGDRLQRELLYEGADMDACASTLRMLIVVEEDRRRDRQNDRVFPQQSI